MENLQKPKTGQLPQQNGYKAPAVHKAFEVLRTVAEARRGLKIVELAEKLGYSNSTTHGLVHALLREKALIQGDDSRELFLGPLIADLTFTDWNYVTASELAQPIIDEIRDFAKATVFLGVRIHNRIMITAKAEAHESLKISAPLGTNIPVFAGAAGKVLLAQETMDRIVQLIGEKGLPRYTSNTRVNPEEYLADLKQVRTQGYAIDDEEYLAGIRAVAVALNNRKGLPMAIWVVAIANTMGMDRLKKVAEGAVLSVKKLCAHLEEKGVYGFGK